MFMRVTNNILDAEIETLETSTSRCHSLGYQAAGCVANTNSAHNSNVLYIANIVGNEILSFYLNVVQCLDSSHTYALFYFEYMNGLFAVQD